MADDLIRKATVLKKIKRLSVQYDAETVQRCIEAVSNTRSIKGLERVKHGYWMVGEGDRNTGYDGGEIICSNCSTGGFSDFWDYCPNCGARMDEEDSY